MNDYFHRVAQQSSTRLWINNATPGQGHPLVPTLQLTVPLESTTGPLDDFDLVLQGDSSDWMEQIRDLLLRAVSRTYQPKLLEQGNIDFQITRGLLGVSL